MGNNIENENKVREFWTTIKYLHGNFNVLKSVFTKFYKIDNVYETIIKNDGMFYRDIIALYDIRDSIKRLSDMDLLLKKTLIKITPDFIRTIHSIDTKKIYNLEKTLYENRDGIKKIGEISEKLRLINVKHIDKIIYLSKHFSLDMITKLRQLPSSQTINSLLNTMSSLDKKYHNITTMQNKLEKHLEIVLRNEKAVNEVYSKLNNLDISISYGKSLGITYDEKLNRINVTINKDELKGKQGDNGRDGVGLSFNTIGLERDRYLYNNQNKGFVFFAYDIPAFYIKYSNRPNDWTRPIIGEFFR